MGRTGNGKIAILYFEIGGFKFCCHVNKVYTWLGSSEYNVTILSEVVHAADRLFVFSNVFLYFFYCFASGIIKKR